MNLINQCAFKLAGLFKKPFVAEKSVWGHISTAPKTGEVIMVTDEAYEFEFPALWSDHMDDMSGYTHTGWAQEEGLLALDEDEYCLWRPMQDSDRT
jgi:hypothetical protein